MFGLSKRAPESPAASSSTTSTATQPRREAVLAVDIQHHGDGLTIIADVPGCTRDDLDIAIDDGVLSLRATPRATAPAGYQQLHAGIADTVLVRSFALPDVVDAERIAATVKDGVLRLSLPKRAEAKPRRIAVA